jgi:hypothetical protein
MVLAFTATVQSEETENPIEQTESIVETNQPTISFNVDPKQLAESIGPTGVQWIDVRENKHLLMIIEHRAKNERGNILLLHAQGENPNHPRLNFPLASQLSQLGWNVFIPHLPTEDFPIPTALENQNGSKGSSDGQQQTEEQANAEPEQEQSSSVASTETEKSNSEQNAQESNPNLPQYFFESEEQYQKYFVEICEAVKNNTKIVDLPTAIVSNQNSSFWALPCLSIIGNITPIVMLEPQFPSSAKPTLEKQLSDQSEPLYALITSESTRKPFFHLLNRGKWGGKNQRTNTSLLPKGSLPMENITIAKSITGWIEKQRK